MLELSKTLWAPRVNVKRKNYNVYKRRAEDAFKVFNGGIVPDIRITKREKHHLRVNKEIKSQFDPSLGPVYGEQMFIEFKKEEFAQAALQHGQGLLLDGMVVDLQWAEKTKFRKAFRKRYRNNK